MSEEELRVIYEKTKGIMHITQHKRFWDYFNLLKEKSSFVEKLQKAVERENHYAAFYKDLCEKQQKKIEEKIKELEDYMILFTNDKEKFNRYKYARNVLEKLLKENNND